MTAVETLKQYFGYDAFRAGQEELICDIITGRDVLGIMPTGAGKSMCFWVPALMLDGITLVVSPLISLMKDQVAALIQSGISAAYINSSLTDSQITKALYNAANGVYKLVYVAPERLMSYDFISFAKSVNIQMLTVDEAHCISQWGQDFRPSYAKIPEFIAQLPNRPRVSAFTATATPNVRDDILRQLDLKNPTVLVTGFDRENLRFEIVKPKDKFLALLQFVKEKKDRIGIVYCSTRAAVEEVCTKLQKQGLHVSRYHAGLSDKERRDNQDDFLYDRVQIMVATNAFGMGIDKSNVSFVVHYNMPMNLEAYYQEAGRAGRDGQPADCLLLYNGQDVRLNMWMIDNASDVEYPDFETETIIKERDRKRLKEMTFYCATKDCLRGYILKYFGEKPGNYCGNCTNCNTNFETMDITEEAKKIISCVARMKERFGVVTIIGVLQGSKNEKILRSKLDQLSTYGISKMSTSQLRDIIDHLILYEALIKTDEKYPIIKLGPNAGDILSGQEAIIMKLAKQEPEKKATKHVNTKKNNDEVTQVAKSNNDTNTKDQSSKALASDLFEKLKEVRLNLANEQGVPAFVILHDSSLTDMCAKRPKTMDDLMKVSGIGKVKAQKFGEHFLRVIKEQT